MNVFLLETCALVVRASFIIGFAASLWLALKKARASAAMRALPWIFCLAGLLLLPALIGALPALKLPLLPAPAASAAAGGSALVAASGPALPTDRDSGWVGLVAYLIVTSLLLVRFLAGRRQLQRMWREAETSRAAGWAQLVADLSAQLRLARTVELRLIARPIMPMTWGSVTPKVLLPAEAKTWTPERRRLVVLHELAHVRRFDSMVRSASAVACAFYWFHPGVWLAARQLRLEQELAADEAVVQQGIPPSSYARNLLNLARDFGKPVQPAPAATMAGRWQLEQRLVAIAAPASGPDLTRSAFLSCAAISALAACLAAAIVPVRAPASRISRLPTDGRIQPPQAARTRPAGLTEGIEQAPSSNSKAVAAGRAKAPLARSAESTSPSVRQDGLPSSKPLVVAAAVPEVSQEIDGGTPTSTAPVYGPELEPSSKTASRDYRWRLKEDPGQTERNQGSGGSAEPTSTGPPARAARLTGQSFRIAPSLPRRSLTPQPSRPGDYSTMLSWVVGSANH